MSQRSEGFNGGVQVGTSATSEISRGLERILQIEQRKFIPNLDTELYRYVKGLNGEEYKTLVGSGLVNPVAGMSPDGGIFLHADSGVPKYMGECKKQGLYGNAIERWAKNASMANRAGVERYTTYCLGEGFYDGGTAQNQLASILVSLDPGMTDIWNEQDRKFGFYRFRTIEEAEELMPSIVREELLTHLSFIS